MRRRTPAPLLALAALVLAGLVQVPGAAAVEPTTVRVQGTDRYATAAAVSADAFEPGVAVAYVATGAGFPDALAGGPAAARERGPLLLTEPGALPPATSAELQRLRPRRIVVLGGPAAVGEPVVAALTGLTDGTVTRLSGPDRYATAAEISRAGFAPGVASVHITTGTGFADALAAGPAAGSKAGPVLLVAPGSLPAATAQELTRLRPQSITVVGGPVAVWPQVEESLRAYTTGRVTRVFGADRHTTAAEISRRTFAAPAPTVYLATGASFPDALAGGPAAALGRGPLMLVQRDCVPTAVLAELTRLQPSRVVLLGGPGAVGDGVAQSRPCATGPTLPAGRVAGGPARSVVLEAPDYASEAHSDPWDYSNPQDIHIGTPQMSDAGQVRDGQLSYVTATAYPWMDPVPYLPGSIPLVRDGPSAPIDTARYTHVSMRVYSSKPGAGLMLWNTCDWSKLIGCQGATSVPVAAGWKTYDVLMTPTLRTAAAAWSGKALGLRFLPGGEQGVTIKVDWMRLHGAAAPVRFDLEPAQAGTTNEVLWDSDADLANNTADRPGWGRLGTTTGTGIDFPVAVYPPGAYRLYTTAGGRTGPYTEALHVLPRPRPVVDSPSLAGGADYATTVRGNAWDFSGMNDVGPSGNVCNARILTGGVLAAENCAAPDIDNPHFTLPSAGSFSGSTWSRLTVRLRYDGPFGLTGGPTGGAVARLVWYVASARGADQNIHDIVVHPGWQTITVDLATNPPSAITDETQRATRVGWAGQTITGLRLDPNEDVSARRWYVDFVRLTREESGRGGFTVRLRETSGTGGQTAQVFLDRDRAGADGVAVASAPLAGSGTSVPFALPASLPTGRYWPYVVVNGPTGRSVRYASAPVQLTR